MDLSVSALPLSLLKPAASTTASSQAGGLDETARRTRIAKAGKDYEGAFLSIMLGQMMSGVKASSFGGGEGEEAFKSFLTDAMAKSMVRHGGVGLSRRIETDMLKLQGLSATPAAVATAPGTLAAPSTPAQAPAQTLDIAA